jgi:magnesium transporter
VNEAVAAPSVPMAASPAATAQATTTDHDARRALNSEYLRHHPDEVARFLDERMPQETALIVHDAGPEAAVHLLERLNPRVAAEVLRHMPAEAAKIALRQMHPARAAPIVASFEANEREAVLTRLPRRFASEVRELLTYPFDTAGALMDPRITAFTPDTTVDDALRKMRTFKEKELGAIYLTDGSGRLVGSVPLGEIATAAPDTKLRDLVSGQPVGVQATATREEIVNYLTEQRVATLPVVDGDGRLVGVIRYRALVAAAEAEATMSMQTMVGVSKEERALSRVSFAVRQRLPWLEINLATAFLAASVVGMFEGTIAKFTALAILLPVVAGQSGNSGMQALAVTMRGLALREVRLSHWPRLIAKEAGVGVLNGLAVAATTMVGVFVWSQSVGLTLVIGTAMVLAMVMAGISGAAIPLLLKAAGQDPAQSSSIVLTTVTDCSSFLSFLGLASILLQFL